MDAPTDSSRPRVELLTRGICTICQRVHERLAVLAAELDFDLTSTDVDVAAAAGDTALRSEFGDRLPVVLLDGREHSYWDIDEPRLRADLARRTT
ncbi:MAG: glutaredoxin family protein [Mycobacterium sp.]